MGSNAKEGGSPPSKKIQLRLEGLSFGDGTGFAGEDGIAVPRKLTERSSLNRCLPQQNDSRTRALERLDSLRLRRSNPALAENLPASFLPVNFLGTDLLRATLFNADPEPDDCCPGANCTSLINHVEHPCVNCPNQNRPTITYWVIRQDLVLRQFMIR